MNEVEKAIIAELHAKQRAEIERVLCKWLKSKKKNIKKAIIKAMEERGHEISPDIAKRIASNILKPGLRRCLGDIDKR